MDNTFPKKESLPLFDQERPRRNDPIGSYHRADEMNADQGKRVTGLMIEVLRVVIEYPARTAAQLGEKMSRYNPAKYEWPHKAMKRLENAGLVDRIYNGENPKQLTCIPTDKAKQFIEGLDQ